LKGLVNANFVGVDGWRRRSRIVLPVQKQAVEIFIHNNGGNPVYGRRLNPGHRSPDRGRFITNEIRTGKRKAVCWHAVRPVLRPVHK
jgi:hypothetical protein